jgi:uncharacterized cupredoxin-like copper-binding protein
LLGHRAGEDPSAEGLAALARRNTRGPQSAFHFIVNHVIDPAPGGATGKAGTIAFTVTNNGANVHEFVIVKTDLKADSLPVSGELVDESAFTPVDEIEDIATGSTQTLTVDLAAGHYVILCNIEEHYAKGSFIRIV